MKRKMTAIVVGTMLTLTGFILATKAPKLEPITVVGLIAGGLTTLAYLPQSIKIWQSKSATDLSWSMLILLCSGILLWLLYAVAIQDIPILVANIVTLLLTSTILVMKIRYSKSFLTLKAKRSCQVAQAVRK